MSTHKNINRICVAATLLSIVLTVLLMNSRTLGLLPIVSEAASGDLFTTNDLDGNWDTASATRITLSDSGSTISGNGAYVYGGNVYIVCAGRYVLTGTLTDGSVIIDAEKSDKIWVSLSDVTIHCEDSAAIRVEQADKVFLTLADGTENSVSSGAQYSAESAASGVDGVIYSRDDLTINGTGALSVNAAYSHGIVCNDNLVITGGNLTISAVQDGIHANDSVRIQDAAISVSAGDDGITVSNDEETAFLYIASGSITIPTCYEGLEAVEITIAGGTIHIVSADDGINASGGGRNSVIRITDGDITIINPSGRDADGLDSNGSIYMEGGRLFISVTDGGGNCALDCGTENGGECIISGGTVIACGGSMMAEGFDADSPQGFLMYRATAAAGTVIRLEDSLGRELISGEIPCSFSSAVLSTPGLQIGDICTITIGDRQEQITIDNTSSDFGFHGMFGNDMPGRNDRGGMSDGMQPPDRRDTRGDGNFSGRQEIREGEAGALPQDPQNPRDTQNPREVGGKAFASGNVPSSHLSPDTLILLGISVLTLLAGLLIAIKIKH